MRSVWDCLSVSSTFPSSSAIAAVINELFDLYIVGFFNQGENAMASGPIQSVGVCGFPSSEVRILAHLILSVPRLNQRLRSR